MGDKGDGADVEGCDANGKGRSEAIPSEKRGSEWIWFTLARAGSSADLVYAS